MSISAKKNGRFTDVNGKFDDEVNLFNIIGQKKVTEQLTVIREGIFNSISKGSTQDIEPILIIGPTSDTFSRAFSNSLGNLQFYQTYGNLLYAGGDSLERFLNQGSELATYMIKESDTLTPYCSFLVYKVIEDKLLHIHSYDNYQSRDIPFNSLLILAARDETKINPAIRDHIKIICRLEGYSRKDIYDILVQRITCLDWEVKKMKLMEHISFVSHGDVGLAINILAWTYRCAVAKDEEVMNEKHLNQALRLLQ